MVKPRIGEEEWHAEKLRRLGARVCRHLNPGGCYCAENKKPMCSAVGALALEVLAIALEEKPKLAPAGKPPPKRTRL